ncbi:MAG TPA: hypothetical protein VEU51_18590 [Candidatus Acidoferrales bacterium]|nr:hypothetical protein [Candidatus Acidoferrales bacterium]
MHNSCRTHEFAALMALGALLLSANSARGASGAGVPMTTNRAQGSQDGSNELEIPRPAPQQIRPIPAPSANVIPPLPGAQTLEIPLPEVFRGCWQGVVRYIDSQVQLAPPMIGGWIPKTYRICYVQSGRGPFKPTISETGLIANGRAVRNARSRLEVLSTDGRTQATMRAYLHFDEDSHGLFGLFSQTGSVDELTHMNCAIDGGVMHVQGDMYGEWNRRPWTRVTWHADFSSVVN